MVVWELSTNPYAYIRHRVMEKMEENKFQEKEIGFIYSLFFGKKKHSCFDFQKAF